MLQVLAGGEPMQDLLIACFIVIVCAMGAWVALSGATTRKHILQRDQTSLPRELE
jgi:hypothetical protein